MSSGEHGYEWDCPRYHTLCNVYDCEQCKLSSRQNLDSGGQNAELLWKTKSMALRWCGGRTSDNLPRRQIVNLTVGLLIIASLSLLSQVVTTVIEVINEIRRVGGPWNITPRFITYGVLFASTGSVIISAIVNFQPCNFVSVIVVNRFAALVCAVNAVWSAIGLHHSIENGGPISSHLVHLAGLLLTVSYPKFLY